MPSAVLNLRDPDPNVQVIGAAYIQHECYNNAEAKNEVYTGLIALYSEVETCIGLTFQSLSRLSPCESHSILQYLRRVSRPLQVSTLKSHLETSHKIVLILDLFLATPLLLQYSVDPHV